MVDYQRIKNTVNKIKTPLEKNFIKSKTLVGFIHSSAQSPKTVKGFTLMEIVVSLIILATVFGGLTATFVGVKRYVSRANRRLTAVNLGKQALNSLYVQVRADWWNTGVLVPSANRQVFNAGVTQVPSSITIDDYTYGAALGAADGIWPDPNSYRVRAVPGSEYREVTVELWYPTN